MEGKQEEDREEEEAEEEARGRAASGSREQGQHVEREEGAGCCGTLGPRMNPPTHSHVHTDVYSFYWHLISIFMQFSHPK